MDQTEILKHHAEQLRGMRADLAHKPRLYDLVIEHRDGGRERAYAVLNLPEGFTASDWAQKVIDGIKRRGNPREVASLILTPIGTKLEFQYVVPKRYVGGGVFAEYGRQV